MGWGVGRKRERRGKRERGEVGDGRRKREIFMVEEEEDEQGVERKWEEKEIRSSYSTLISTYEHRPNSPPGPRWLLQFFSHHIQLLTSKHEERGGVGHCPEITHIPLARA